WNADGSLDASFGSSGVASSGTIGVAATANSIVREPDGGFVVVGYSIMSLHETDVVLARFDLNGNLGMDFGIVIDPIFTSQSRANAVIRQPDGKVVIAGTTFTLIGMPPSPGQVGFLARYLGVFACGNGIVEPGESCDDGNTLGNDCCTPECQRPSCRAAGKS